MKTMREQMGIKPTTEKGLDVAAVVINHGGRLEKIVPARKKSAVFLWIREFMLFKTFEDARKTMGIMRKKDKKCWWCSTNFEGSNMLFLGAASKPKAGNVLLCRQCAELAQSSDL